MATESRRRRRWVVPALLLGAGAWVIVRRRSAAEPVDVWAPRPPVERMVVPPVPTPAEPLAPAPPIAAAQAPLPDTDLPVGPGPVTASVARPLLAAPTPTVSGVTAPATTAIPDGLGSAAPLPDGSAPGPEYTIKGKASSRLFHPPSSPYYGRTKAEVWFRTADDALAAGYSQYRSRRR